MRMIVAGTVFAVLAVSGCSDEPDPRTGPDLPDKTKTVSVKNPGPVLDVLGDDWKASDAAAAEVRVCGLDVLPTGKSKAATVTDGDGRVVRIEFVKVRSTAAAVEKVTKILDDCPISSGETALYYTWTAPSSTFPDATTGVVLVADPNTSAQLPGAVAVAVAPAVSGTVVSVSVYAAAGDDAGAETLEVYADLIARNQVDANTGADPKPVPAYDDVKAAPNPEPTTDPVVPPVGTTTYEPGSEG